jgi:hypothetical protein
LGAGKYTVVEMKVEAACPVLMKVQEQGQYHHHLLRKIVHCFWVPMEDHPYHHLEDHPYHHLEDHPYHHLEDHPCHHLEDHPYHHLEDHPYHHLEDHPWEAHPYHRQEAHPCCCSWEEPHLAQVVVGSCQAAGSYQAAGSCQ